MGKVCCQKRKITYCNQIFTWGPGPGRDCKVVDNVLDIAWLLLHFQAKYKEQTQIQIHIQIHKEIQIQILYSWRDCSVVDNVDDITWLLQRAQLMAHHTKLFLPPAKLLFRSEYFHFSLCCCCTKI